LAGLVVAAVIGVFVFTGRPGWPAWYTLLWIPGALLVIAPAVTWASLTAIALAAGAGAGLMTWGNALAARTVVALADVGNLGTQPDPLAEPALTELAASIVASSRPPDEADLYRAWRRSGLRREGYPVRLMVWDGPDLDADVAMDALSLSDRRATGRGRRRLSIARLAVGRVCRVLARPGSPGSWPGGDRTADPPAVPAPLEMAQGVLRSFGSPYTDERTRRRRHPGRGAGSWSLRATRRVTCMGRTSSMVIPGPALIDPSSRGLPCYRLAAALANAVPTARRVVIRSIRPAFCETPRLIYGFFVVRALIFGQHPTAGRGGGTECDLVLQRILATTTAEASPLADIAPLDARLGIYCGGAGVRGERCSPRSRSAAPGGWGRGALVLDMSRSRPRGRGYTRRGFAVAGPSQGQGGTILATVHEERDRELRDRQLDVALGFGLATLLGLFAAGGAARLAARSEPAGDR
jgi:hypothetical protein